MTKIFLIGFFISVTIGLLAFFIFENIGEDIENNINKAKSELGHKVKLGKDTLSITDYSILNENYTLSNGTKISFTLADSLKVVK